MEEENPLLRATRARFAALRLLLGGGRTVRTDQRHVRNYGAVEADDVPQIRTQRKCWCLPVLSIHRKMFSLLVGFDFILVFILWGIYVKIKDPQKTLTENFLSEVVSYTIFTSMFDAFLCGVIRFLLLILAYTFVRLKNPSVIAVTTFLTCLFVVVKIFAFKPKDGANPICYVMLVEEFVIAWVETWMLDFRVLPQEQQEDNERRGIGPTARPLLAPHRDIDSPFHTPEEGSDDECPSPIPPDSYEDSQFRTKAEDNWNRARHIIQIRDGWKPESVSTPDIHVHSRQTEKLGKLFRVEAYIESSPEDVFRVTSLEYDSAPRWNKTVIDCRVLQNLGDDTDISYNVTAAAGGGVVSSRDFVTVRKWKRLENGDMLSVACAVEHSRKPPDKRYVRGENKLSAFVYRSVPNHPNRCLMFMYVSTDIKGWIPQVVVDQALAGVLVDFVHCLRSHQSEIYCKA